MLINLGVSPQGLGLKGPSGPESLVVYNYERSLNVGRAASKAQAYTLNKDFMAFCKTVGFL